jgi:chitin disaccharide deacetylase
MPIVDAPILIVNADDYGWNQPTTDATLEAFRAGRITSATALMYMRDSERAAELALEAGLPVGLHLNLTDPFDGDDVPTEIGDRQMRAVRHFGAPATVWRSRRWLYDPRAVDLTKAAIADQLDRFRRLFGREPTHFDGHNHVHLCPDVALSLPGGVKVRTALGIGGGGKKGRLLRARQRITLRDRVTTRHFLNITGLHPQFVAGGPRSLLGQAATTSVEVMAHPGFGHEFTLLMVPAWQEWTAGLRTGSYADLG